MYKRIYNKRIFLIGIILAVLLVTNAIIGSKFMIIMPGITRELSELIKVEGGNPDKPGSFLLTAVSTRSANIPLLLYNLINPQIDIIPKSEVIPEGWDMEEYVQYMQRWMLESQKVAEVVALREAGYQTLIHGEGAQIVKIMEDSPAENLLKEGDIVKRASGSEVFLAEDLVRIVTSHNIGDKVKLEVLRNNNRLEFMVDIVESMSQNGKPAIGVYVTTYMWKPELPIDIQIHTGDIGGPSAGSMFVLEILNQLSDENLAGGRIIAGTGTVDLTGRIGEIGGVVQKVYTAYRDGATLFFTPTGNANDAIRAGKNLNMQIVPVETIKDCIDYLKKGGSE